MGVRMESLWDLFVSGIMQKLLGQVSQNSVERWRTHGNFKRNFVPFWAMIKLQMHGLCLVSSTCIRDCQQLPASSCKASYVQVICCGLRIYVQPWQKCALSPYLSQIPSPPPLHVILPQRTVFSIHMHLTLGNGHIYNFFAVHELSELQRWQRCKLPVLLQLSACNVALIR